MRAGKETLAKLNDLREAMYKHEVTDLNLFDHTATLTRLVKLAHEHGNIQEKKCCVELTARQEKREETIEKEITAIASQFGLKTMFTGDPRGFTVKLLSDKCPDFYNSWGGKEHGYGL